eukprot:Skav215828  [mRNA]  locus=scaffold2501:88349:96618:- [translate_table: standard]
MLRCSAVLVPFLLGQLWTVVVLLSLIHHVLQGIFGGVLFVLLSFLADAATFCLSLRFLLRSLFQLPFLVAKAIKALHVVVEGRCGSLMLLFIHFIALGVSVVPLPSFTAGPRRLLGLLIQRRLRQQGFHFAVLQIPHASFTRGSNAL